MDAKIKFGIPDSFAGSLKNYEAKQKMVAEKEKQKCEREKEKRHCRKETQKRNAEKDLKYAKMIFEWAGNFRKSPEGKRAFDIARTSRRGEASLCFFSHARSYSLYVNKGSIRWYRWGPGSDEHYCTTPQKLAWYAQDGSNCKEGFLKAAFQAIQNGNVWNYINEELQLLTN